MLIYSRPVEKQILTKYINHTSHSRENPSSGAIERREPVQVFPFYSRAPGKAVVLPSFFMRLWDDAIGDPTLDLPHSKLKTDH